MTRLTLTASFLLSISVLFFQSCASDPEVVRIEGITTDSTNMVPFSSVASLDELFDSLSTPPLTARIDVDKDTIVTLGGVTIHLPMNSCCAGSGTLDSVNLEVIPFLNLPEMFKNNVQTESNEQLLVTGGAFSWRLLDDNNNELALNYPVRTEIATETNYAGYENEMRYYEGENLMSGGQEIVNWNLNTSTEGLFMQPSVFTIFGTELGLVNCDALYDIAANDPTQFKVRLSGPNGVEIVTATVWFFVKDFPSVINISTIMDGDLTTYANSIPRNVEGTLVAVGISTDDVLYFNSQDITVAGDDLFEIETAAGTIDDLSTLVDGLASN